MRVAILAPFHVHAYDSTHITNSSIAHPGLGKHCFMHMAPSLLLVLRSTTTTTILLFPDVAIIESPIVCTTYNSKLYIWLVYVQSPGYFQK